MGLNRPPPRDADPPPGGRPPSVTSSGGHCSGRYASYWNTFLFVCLFFYNGSYYIHVVKGVPGFPPVLFLGVRDNKTLGSVNSV